ncbi:MAG: Na-translocating system protein MpsC family protein [Candidatus Saccharibacteria bacterium]
MIPIMRQAHVKEQLRKYAVRKTIELFAKGPDAIDIKFLNDSVLLEMSGILNKFEMKVLETGDEEAVSLLLGLRVRLYKLAHKELHEEVGEIFSRKVIINGPQFDLPNNSLIFNIVSASRN